MEAARPLHSARLSHMPECWLQFVLSENPGAQTLKGLHVGFDEEEVVDVAITVIVVSTVVENDDERKVAVVVVVFSSSNEVGIEIFDKAVEVSEVSFVVAVVNSKVVKVVVDVEVSGGFVNDVDVEVVVVENDESSQSHLH